MKFKSTEHEKYYYKWLTSSKKQDVYHKALFYCLALDSSCITNFKRIYDAKADMICTECICEGWQTSGSLRAIRLAFQLFTNTMPTVFEFDRTEDRFYEYQQYSVVELFSCGNISYFFEAIKIRYGDFFGE